MINLSVRRTLRAAVLAGTALSSVAAFAQSTDSSDRPAPPTSAIDTPGIVVNDGVGINTPAAQGGAFDNTVNLTGVGQMFVPNADNTIGTCTGTLINRRTVIFAAHCVNTRAANTYGTNTGGQSIGFGFNAYNNAATGEPSAVRRYLGLTGGTRGQTDLAWNVYNAEQVWYDPRSLQVLSGGAGFIQADVAIATLDTPATNIPTWALLFTPLSGPTHATVNGYGGRGNGTTGSLGVDWRRRIAENMIDFLGSLNDRNASYFGSRNAALGEAAVYQLDFDSPNESNQFDFNGFGGITLPNEGSTAGGDSGGPLIVDQKFAIKVVAGVLSGGSRFFNGQPDSSYGGQSFYQPLHLYWDVIVANNPYVYASNRGGDKNWSDASNWIQNMDPAYMVEGANGQLINSTPGTAAIGVAAGGPRFGQTCGIRRGFYDDACYPIETTVTTAPVGTGNPTGRGREAGDGRAPAAAGAPGSIQIAGGPGSTDFTPNNVTADPRINRRSRYFDVTLSAFGTTTVDGNFTVDKLAMTNASTGLRLGAGNTLGVVSEYTQTNGTLTFAGGTLRTGGDAMIFQGHVLGSGTMQSPFTTVMMANLLPGDTALVSREFRNPARFSLGNDQIGTLTFNGNLILTSAATTWINTAGAASDRIAVTGAVPAAGQSATAGLANLGGTLVVKPTGESFGQTYTILTATNGVTGTFNQVLGGSAVINLTTTYNANDVQVRINANSLAAVAAAPTANALAFATALDSMRGTSYDRLAGVYGLVDYLDPASISMALDGMTPRIVNEAALMDREQSRVTMNLVGDRLSMLGTRQANMGRLTVVGSPETLMAGAGQQITGSTAAQLSFAAALTPQGRVMGKLPANVSGFVAGGYTSNPGAGAADRSGWSMAMGLEMEAAPETTLGTAFAYTRGTTRLGVSNAEADTSQAMVYGAYQLGGGAYLGAMASTAHTRFGIQRASLGSDLGSLGGQASAASYSVRGELGINTSPVAGLTLTPRASVAYEGSTLSDYREAGGMFGLAIDDIADHRLVGRFGAKLSGSIGGKPGGWTLVPEARVDFVQTLVGGMGNYNVRFAAAPDLAVALPFAGQDGSWGEVKAGLRMAKDRMALTAGVESSVGRAQFRDDRAVASFSIGF